MDRDRGLAIGLLESSIFGGNTSEVVLFGLQGVNSGTPKSLINRAAGKSMTSSTFWT